MEPSGATLRKTQLRFDDRPPAKSSINLDIQGQSDYRRQQKKCTVISIINSAQPEALWVYSLGLYKVSQGGSLKGQKCYSRPPGQCIPYFHDKHKHFLFLFLILEPVTAALGPRRNTPWTIAGLTSRGRHYDYLQSLVGLCLQLS